MILINISYFQLPSENERVPIFHSILVGQSKLRRETKRRQQKEEKG